MTRILRAATWFFLVRCVFVAVAATPFGLALRMISARHPDGDDALLADLVPRLGDVASREPRTFTLTLGSLALALLCVPLGEAFVDRVGCGILTGQRWNVGVAEAGRDPFRTGLVSVLATVVRGFAVACVVGLVRHEDPTPKALALPGTVALVLFAFVGFVLALRDLVMWPAASTVRARLRVALLTGMRAPFRLVAIATGTRLGALVLAAVAFVASTSPSPLHGVRLLGLYLLGIGCSFLAATLRAIRFAAAGALTGASTVARSAAPGAPSRDPAA